MTKAQRKAIRFACIDCSKNTGGSDTSGTNGTSGTEEYYMVHNEVWLKANPERKGMLCITCLEKRLSRKLQPRDFTGCGLNEIQASVCSVLADRIKG